MDGALPEAVTQSDPEASLKQVGVPSICNTIGSNTVRLTVCVESQPLPATKVFLYIPLVPCGWPKTS